MKGNETKRAFITARAEGKSYSTIQKELGISKATCNSWERLFTGEIKALRGAQMEELYISYGMAKEALYKLALEHSKEETDPLEIDFTKQYRSKLTRHDDAPEA